MKKVFVEKIINMLSPILPDNFSILVEANLVMYCGDQFLGEQGYSFLPDDCPPEDIENLLIQIQHNVIYCLKEHWPTLDGEHVDFIVERRGVLYSVSFISATFKMKTLESFTADT